MKACAVGIGLGIQPKQAWYVPFNGKIGRERVVELIRPLFADPNVSFYAHNAKYDLHVMLNEGIEIENLGFDTMLASYLLNSHSHRHSLDHLSLVQFGKVKTSIESLIGKGKNQRSMSEVPIDEVSTYCCEDVDYTCRLKQYLEKEITDRGLNSLMFDLELPLLKILAKMERRGIYVDRAQLAVLSKEFTARLSVVEQRAHELAGESFNLNSPKQLSVILFEKMGIHPPKKTKTGFSTNAEVLEGLRNEHPIAEVILEHRSLAKLLSTYVDALPEEILDKTGRIHSTYNQGVTATGRLSSQNPNLQNIPVRTDEGRRIRKAFCPQEMGWSFVGGDYSQIELRLLAHLCEDPQLIQAFENGEDIHAFTASQVFNVPLGEVSKQQRQQAKAVNFGIIYGQQAFGLSRELGISVADAQLFIETYFNQYPTVRAFIESCKEKAQRTGRATSIIGRERLIPEITSSNGAIRSSAERLAVNTPLQGSAADLIKLAMLKLDGADTNAHLVLQIHDELIYELPDAGVAAFRTLLKREMESVMDLRVPLVVDTAVGKNWKEC
jgi:DNA polymerase-1